MGKKQKRGTVQNGVRVEIGGGESQEKHKKNKRKSTDEAEVRQNGAVLASDVLTISIAVPGSIIDNAQSLELATRMGVFPLSSLHDFKDENNDMVLKPLHKLAGQLARAATIFRIDEIVVFDSKSTSEDVSIELNENNSGEEESGTAFLLRILRYLETPQYLRRSLFQKHQSLRFVGLLPPLDAPHHLRKHEWASYREAHSAYTNTYPSCKFGHKMAHLIKELHVSFMLMTIFADAHNLSSKLRFSKETISLSLVARLRLRTSHPPDPAYLRDLLGITLENVDRGSVGMLVDVGLSKNVMIDQVLEPGKRVTVDLGADRDLDSGPRKTVPCSRPREEGVYWGYRVRYASNISSVFKSCPYQGGYDHTIGTSEHGSIINSSELTLPSFRHLLIAFGGLAGLEECVEEDEILKGKTVHDIFASYLNTCPHQGSRTIRTEEAIFISLQYFQEPISRVLKKHER